LEATLTDNMSEEKYSEAFNLIRPAAKTNGVDKIIAEFGLDVIVGPVWMEEFQLLLQLRAPLWARYLWGILRQMDVPMGLLWLQPLERSRKFSVS
jgi:hypothetical protein